MGETAIVVLFTGTVVLATLIKIILSIKESE